MVKFLEIKETLSTLKTEEQKTILLIELLGNKFQNLETDAIANILINLIEKITNYPKDTIVEILLVEFSQIPIFNTTDDTPVLPLSNATDETPVLPLSNTTDETPVLPPDNANA